MKLGTQYNGVSASFEFTPEEIDKLVPFFIRALFNIKITTIKTYSLLEQLITECQNKNGWKNFVLKKPYLKEERVCLLIEQMPFFIKDSIKNRFISEYSISNYEMSNIFFAIIEIFINRLKKKDVVDIFERFNDNDQVDLCGFFEFIEKNKPGLLTPKIIDYLRFNKITEIK